MTPRRSRQELDQRRQDRGPDVHEQIAQGLHYWLSGYNGRLEAERYAQGWSYIHIHLSFGSDGMQPPDADYWCVGLYRHPEYLHDTWAHLPDIDKIQDAPPRSSRHSGTRMQQAMLIDAVQFVEDPEGIGSIVIPSLVRLQPLDDCLGVWVPSLNLGQPTSGSRLTLLGSLVEAVGPVPVLVIEDREFRSIGDLLRQRLALESYSERKGEVVERRSHVMQRLTDKQTDRVARWLFRERVAFTVKTL